MDVHLVGSVPFADADEVFSTCCGVLGDRLARVPDGETGIRTNWIAWQRPILGAHPALHEVGAVANAQSRMPRFALRADFDGELAFDDLGYLTAAMDSYGRFVAARDAGRIGGQRFQVSLPTPLAAVAAYIDAPDQAAVFPAYEARLLAEAAAIIDAIPAEDLALQWDVAIEFAVLEGLFPVWLADPFEEIAGKLAALADLAPGDVELGFHLCYGDAGNKHFKEPEDTGLMVRLANRVVELTARRIDWVHLPVPIDRDDEGFFAPLAGLTADRIGRVYLGLAHEQDGAEGARRRIAAARPWLADFGVSTECGLGRRKPEVARALLDLMASL